MYTHRIYAELSIENRDSGEQLTIIIVNKSRAAYFGSPLDPADTRTVFFKDEWKLASSKKTRT
jgi:hypothetical protein